MSRADRRRAAHRTGQPIEIFDPSKQFRVKYDINVPGGPLRDEHPAQFSGQVVSDTEANIVRGIVVKMIQAFGYERVGRAVAGVMCEVINPMSTGLRSLIAIGIAQGTGVDVKVMDVTSCADCGAEREVYTILDPNAEDTEALTEDDQTQHAEDCPTIKAGSDDGLKPVEWRTAPAIIIEHPRRYIPLGTAPSTEAQEAAGAVQDVAHESVIEEVPDGEAIEVTEDDEGIVADATSGSA